MRNWVAKRDKTAFEQMSLRAWVTTRHKNWADKTDRKILHLMMFQIIILRRRIIIHIVRQAHIAGNLKIQAFHQFRFNWMPTKELIELTSGFLYTYLIMFTPHCKKLTIQEILKWVQLTPLLLCRHSIETKLAKCLYFEVASNVGLSYNVLYWLVFEFLIHHVVKRAKKISVVLNKKPANLFDSFWCTL